jgi:hypothetical protein
VHDSQLNADDDEIALQRRGGRSQPLSLTQDVTLSAPAAAGRRASVAASQAARLREREAEEEEEEAAEEEEAEPSVRGTLQVLRRNPHAYPTSLTQDSTMS